MMGDYIFKGYLCLIRYFFRVYLQKIIFRLNVFNRNNRYNIKFSLGFGMKFVWCVVVLMQIVL